MAAEQVGLIGLLLVLWGGGAVVLGYRSERRRWNHGRCRACGAAWQYFDQDSEGGLGFKCGNGHTCWVSYRSVMRRVKDGEGQEM